jgi:hypothetical protein
VVEPCIRGLGAAFAFIFVRQRVLCHADGYSHLRPLVPPLWRLPRMFLRRFAGLSVGRFTPMALLGLNPCISNRDPSKDFICMGNRRIVYPRMAKLIADCALRMSLLARVVGLHFSQHSLQPIFSRVFCELWSASYAVGIGFQPFIVLWPTNILTNRSSIL